MDNKISGSDILLLSLIREGVDVVFGYPGGQIMPVYDRLPEYADSLRHILTRHEQGAIHAAQGYARSKGVPGCVIVTSGPGATNIITGVDDALVDSTPVVVIAGQVPNGLLGTDAFQETDLIGLTTPITKWSHQIRKAEDISQSVARAFYIARTGRPGPVVLDFTKDAQIGMAEYIPAECSFIRSYYPCPKADDASITAAAEMIDKAQKPFCVFGQGIVLSGAEEELAGFLRKGNIKAGSTLMGLSALRSDNPDFAGMVGMHGNLAPNILTQECDLLIAVGMRFSDRVTGKLSQYAPKADIIHIDIDPTEIGKNIPVKLGILSDAKYALARLTEKIKPRTSDDWGMEAILCKAVEQHKIIDPELTPDNGLIHLGEVVNAVATATHGEAVVVTDVGQNQMIAARYSKFTDTRSFITSGGLGTMGFGLPAAIGAKIGVPEKKVVLFVGDGGFQMTEQELGTIMQESTGVKVVLLNNNWLGNVRMWQQLFFKERYSFTRMVNPDFGVLASAYGIECFNVESRDELKAGIEKMFSDDRPFILNVHVQEASLIFPMVPPGKSIDEIMINETEWFDREL